MQPALEHQITINPLSGGSYRWARDEPNAENVFAELQFSTQRMDGFSTGQAILRRRIDLDWPDLNLFDPVVITNGHGDIVWEGRISATPRQLDDSGHSFHVEMTGWMAHARDQPHPAVFVDRDLGAWEGPTLERIRYLSDAARATKFVVASGGSVTRAPSGEQALDTALGRVNVSAAFSQLAEAYYDARDAEADIREIWYAVETRDDAGTALNPADWIVSLSTAPNPDGTGFSTTGSLASGSTGYLAATAGDRFAFAHIYLDVTLTADGAWHAWWRLAVYGDHPVPLIGATDPKGVASSDVIRYTAGRWCPMLDPSGVQDTSYPIGHHAFRDPTDPYEMWLSGNRFHRWELGVFDNRKLHYWPKDLTVADWIVASTDPGAEVRLQGDSVTDLCNGLIVTYDDVDTGTRRTITPDVEPALADTSELNPVNRGAGYPVWAAETLSFPCTYEDMVQFGRALLEERNTPKAPGSLRLGPYVRDRFGAWWPSSMVRCSQTIAVEDFPNDRPRLISETTFDDASSQCEVAVEGGKQVVEAWIDRIAGALEAASVSAPG